MSNGSKRCEKLETLCSPIFKKDDSYSSLEWLLFSFLLLSYRFFKDDITYRHNHVDGDESVLRQEMRFSLRECLDNKHYCKNGVGKCNITKKCVKVRWNIN